LLQAVVMAVITHLKLVEINLFNLIDFKEIRIWDLANQTCTWSRQNAHKGFVKGLCYVPFNSQWISAGEDKTVKLWDAQENEVRLISYNFL
jgi:WD40 repeat protein